MKNNLYEIFITPGEIDFAPDSEAKEILQNVITICTTLKFSRPLNREFGIDPKIIDEPTPKARAKYNAEILSAVKKYEPRAEIEKITWEIQDEKLQPKISIRIKN